MKLALLGTAFLLTMAPTWAINKCTGTDGKVSYQEAPCPSGAKAQGMQEAPLPPRHTTPDADAAAKPPSEADRIEKQVAASQRARRKRTLEVADIPNARRAIDNHNAQCQREMATLRESKGHANNNLAGATWAQAISGEMSAAAARCDSRSRELVAELESLRQECTALSCAPP